MIGRYVLFIYIDCDISQKRSEFREISVSRVLHAGIAPIHGYYFRDMTDF